VLVAKGEETRGGEEKEKLMVVVAVTVIVTGEKIRLQGCWAAFGHDVDEVVVDVNTVEREERRDNSRKQNWAGLFFFPTLHLNLLFFNVWNPIGGERGIFYLY
jgi:hypothetical protein